MRVYLSVDLEGISGVDHPRPTVRGDAGYPDAVELMAGETNAAVAGAFDAGATDVLVNDSHGSMHNLRPASLDPRARVIRGQKVWTMVAGAAPVSGSSSPAFDVAFFVGYHARAGHSHGVLAHTYSYVVVESRLCGRPTGEYGLNAMVLGAWGIPVGLVSGDDALATDVAEALPWAARVVVKEAQGSNAAAALHPTAAREAIRAGAATAVERARRGELEVFRPGNPVSVEVDFCRGIQADLAAFIPGAERLADRTVRYTADDAVVAYRAARSGIHLAGLAD